MKRFQSEACGVLAGTVECQARVGNQCVQFFWKHKYQLQYMARHFNGLQSASEIVHATVLYDDVTAY